MEQFYDSLDQFEVDRDSSLHKLSYGQKKKVIISFGISTNAKYLILDEPTNGLDIPSKSQFRKVILSGFKEDQIMIISTHQVRDLNQLIESVIIIEHGDIILHQDIGTLEQKLRFEKSLSEKSMAGSIHSEGFPGGYVHLLANESGTPSEVELEILFNAAIQKGSELKQLLN
jgi:ABC-2 type transport system ATP-binding protein